MGKKGAIGKFLGVGQAPSFCFTTKTGDKRSDATIRRKGEKKKEKTKEKKRGRERKSFVSKTRTPVFGQ
jgi:hypothetical protein